MAFKSKLGVLVETVVFNGRRYNRYPESGNPAHRKYFARAGHRLHRDVWEFHNGPIPEGMHIHHIDGDTSNNDISNLECITRNAHWDEHRAQLAEFGRSEKQIQHLDSIRGKAAEWHRSEEGRAWHREHAKQSLAKTWGKRRKFPSLTLQCVWCGTEMQAKSERKRFCGATCQTAESKFRLGKSRTEHPHHASCVRPDCGG